MDVPLSWVIIGLCVLAHFFFSAGETALACANRFKMQVEADDGKKSARLVLHVCEKYDRALITVLIGSNIVSIVASAISTILFYHLLSSTNLVPDEISMISSVVISLSIYVIGDALPKTIARSIPDTISKALVYPIYWLMLILFPITFVFEKLTKLIERIFKVKDETTFDEEDFENVVEKVSDEGVIEEEQGEIIQSALEFADTNVKEVLTPREKIFALDINGLSSDKLFDVLETTSFSRIPIYKHTIDNIIGVLHVKIFFKQYMQKKDIRISKTLQKPYFVSSKIMIDDLFNGFKKKKTHIAFVRDNKMRVIGMVTMDDVLEELVGNIGETETKGGNK